MIAWWFGALLVQSAAPGGTPPSTVGDTVRVARLVVVPADALLRFPVAPPSELYTFLGPPQIEGTANEGVRRLEYALVAWRPGRHRIDVPGPVVVRSNGRADTLPPMVASIDIVSILPRGEPDTLPPQPATSIVVRTMPSWLPVGILLGVGGLLLLPVYWWWNGRRGEARTWKVTPPVWAGAPDPERLRRWTAKRESAVAVRHWLALFESDRGRPTTPEKESLLTRLGEARFGPPDSPSMERVCDEASSWWDERLEDQS